VLARQAGGARVLDVRDPVEFAGAHLRGSLNIGLGGSYATWCGTLLKPEEEIVVIAEPGREKEATTRLGRIGYDRVVGDLEGGMHPLDQRQDLVDRTTRITVANLAEQREAGESPTLLDIRNAGEWRAEHAAGSVNVPLGHLTEQIRDLPEGPVVVQCASGYRSSIAASLLTAMGRKDVSDLVGGLAAWEVAGFPVEKA